MTDFRLTSGITEAEFKQILAYLFAQTGGTATTGVVSGLGVTQTGTASGSVLVGTGMGIVQDAVLSGVTPLVNNSALTLDVFTGSPMSGVSNPRNDVVVFNGLTGDIGVIIGTPNAAPTDPTVPATSLKLARLRHAANATTIPAAKIDDLRVFTGLAQRPGSPYAMATFAGFVGSTIAAGDIIGPLPQTFPAGRFTVPPIITFGYSDTRCSCSATGITSTGFNLYIRNVASTASPAPATAYWVATQMTPTSAT